MKAKLHETQGEQTCSTVRGSGLKMRKWNKMNTEELPETRTQQIRCESSWCDFGMMRAESDLP